MQAKSKHTVTALVAGFLTIVLTACGGGGGSGVTGGDTGGGGALPVEKPALTSQPASQSVVQGSAAVFTATATGGAALAYQWKKNGTDISGATSSIYITPVTTMADDGAQFSVVVGNSAGTVTSNAARLTVTDVAVAPAITRHPESLSVVTGSAASFSVSATGTSPLIYQWKKNGTDIPGASSSTYTTPATSDADIGAALVYSVVVTNGAGTATSSNARLTVTTVVAAPAITRQPSAQTVTAGQVASFSVAATGTSPGYQWQKNGTDIPGATASSYTIVAASTEDNAAVFAVVVSNSAGQVSSSEARLAVVPAPPVITTQPAHQTVSLGKTATFTVAASGTGTLRYQWQKFGANIPEATAASYTTPVTTFFDNAALYSVVVSDSVGNTVTSSNATLVLSKYSLVRKPGGGTYGVTECVKDNSTGLIWEGKNPSDSSSRLGTTTYTHYDSTETAQKWNRSISNYVPATEEDLIAPTNSLGYVKLVNESGLCGYTNWRLPTLDELQAIVDVSQTSTPKIDSMWFPNTQAFRYWTSTPYVAAAVAVYVMFVNFAVNVSPNPFYDRNGYSHVRLVRGEE